jgi:hypothetical protein
MVRGSGKQFRDGSGTFCKSVRNPLKVLKDIVHVARDADLAMGFVTQGLLEQTEKATAPR